MVAGAGSVGKRSAYGAVGKLAAISDSAGRTLAIL
jgi:hypothetical protein